jgi:predicted nucleic acid-binding protein
MKVVFDTNILIDYLNGNPDANAELHRYQDRYISRIVWMEVLCGVFGRPQEQITRQFLHSFTVTELDSTIAEEAIQIRRQFRLKLPDAIVLATARFHQCKLVTRNTKDFDSNWPEVHVPY